MKKAAEWESSYYETLRKNGWVIGESGQWTNPDVPGVEIWPG